MCVSVKHAVNEGTEAACVQLSDAVRARARDVVDFETIQGQGLVLSRRLREMRRINVDLEVRAQMAHELYWLLVERIENSVGLTLSRRDEIIMSLDTAYVRMLEDTPKEAWKFMDRWRRAQYLKYKHGVENDPMLVEAKTVVTETASDETVAGRTVVTETASDDTNAGREPPAGWNNHSNR